MFKYPVEVRERATRMVLERLGDYRSVNAAVTDLRGKLNVGVETLRKEVRDLREANEILHASAGFSGNLDFGTACNSSSLRLKTT
mgnify:CR=1 FL=1